MTIELIKQLMDTCYLAKRARDLLPPLPDGVTSSYIQYLDVIQRLEAKGVRARVSDLSDALNLPRPGVTRTVKEMERKGYLQKQVSAEDGQVTYLLLTDAGRLLSKNTTATISRALPPVWTISRRQTQSVPSGPLKNSIRSCVKGETSMKSDKSDFTQGSILQKLVLFMLPVLGALVLQAAYGAVDLLVVGHFGSTSGLSAVSTGSQVLNLVTFVVTQFAMGITVLIARYLGEKRPQYIGQVIGGSIVVFALISAVLFVVLVGFARPISVLMQAPEEALGLTSVRICGAGIFFIVAYNLLAAIFRGLGDS